MKSSEENNCVFCEILSGSRTLVAENEHAAAFLDGIPVMEGHTLVVSKRHVPDFFEMTSEEVEACYAIAQEVQESLKTEDPTIADFNIGVNSGPTAGQTIPHTHIHLFPRRKGDVENPRGGVRRMFPWPDPYLQDEDKPDATKEHYHTKG